MIRASGYGCDGTQDREFEDAGAVAEAKDFSIGAVQISRPSSPGCSVRNRYRTQTCRKSRADKDGTCENEKPTLIGCVIRICHCGRLSRQSRVASSNSCLHRTILSRTTKNLGAVHRHNSACISVYKGMVSAPGHSYSPMKLRKR